MATYYKVEITDGKVKSVSSEVHPKNGKYFTYEELQRFIKHKSNGLVEIVPLPSGESMVVNEEGKLIGLPKNELATEFWKKQYPIEEYPFNNDELIVGNALVIKSDELEND